MTKSTFKNQTLSRRLTNACKGIYFCWQEENSFRTHIILGLITTAVFAFLHISLIWWALIILCIGLILAAETLNTAIEALIDHLHPEIHPNIGMVKDIMAGMVLILSLMAVIIAILAITDKLS